MIDIARLKAGPALDEIIAKEVMGWTDWREDSRGRCVKPPGEDSRRFIPSINIADAWEVVARLREEHLHLYLNDVIGGQWRVCFVSVGESIHDWVRDPNDFPTVWEEHLPFAICMAALKARGGFKNG